MDAMSCYRFTPTFKTIRDMIDKSSVGTRTKHNTARVHILCV